MPPTTLHLSLANPPGPQLIGRREGNNTCSQPPNPLLELPVDIFRLIIERCLSYDPKRSTNLRDAFRLLRVCRAFRIEVIYDISVSGLLWRMSDSKEMVKLGKRATALANTWAFKAMGHPPPPRCGGLFLASYVMVRHRPVMQPWNANLFTVIDAVVDIAMRFDGHDPVGPQRYDYVSRLCQSALPLSENDYDRGFDVCDLASAKTGRAYIFPKRGPVTRKSLESIVLVSQVYLKTPNIADHILSLMTVDPSRGILSFTKLPYQKTLFGTLMEAAIRSGDLDLIAVLLYYDIDSRQPEMGHRYSAQIESRQLMYDRRYLHLAFASDSVEAVKMLLPRCPKSSIEAEMMMLRDTICKGNGKILQVLLKFFYPDQDAVDRFSSDLNAPQHGKNTIIAACYVGNVDILHILLQFPYASRIFILGRPGAQRLWTEMTAEWLKGARYDKLRERRVGKGATLINLLLDQALLETEPREDNPSANPTNSHARKPSEIVHIIDIVTSKNIDLGYAFLNPQHFLDEEEWLFCLDLTFNANNEGDCQNGKILRQIQRSHSSHPEMASEELVRRSWQFVLQSGVSNIIDLIKTSDAIGLEFSQTKRRNLVCQFEILKDFFATKLE